MDGESNLIHQSFKTQLEFKSKKEVVIKITCDFGMSEIQLASLLVSLADEVLRKEAGMGSKNERTAN